MKERQWRAWKSWYEVLKECDVRIDALLENPSTLQSAYPDLVGIQLTPPAGAEKDARHKLHEELWEKNISNSYTPKGRYLVDGEVIREEGGEEWAGLSWPLCSLDACAQDSVNLGRFWNFWFQLEEARLRRWLGGNSSFEEEHLENFDAHTVREILHAHYSRVAGERYQRAQETFDAFLQQIIEED